MVNDKELRKILLLYAEDLDLIDYDKSQLGVAVNIYSRVVEATDKAVQRIKELIRDEA